MLPIILGMPALILLMVLVIGGPIVYYSRKDRAFGRLRDQPDDVRLLCWYNKTAR